MELDGETEDLKRKHYKECTEAEVK